ncbi:hypothetical protein K402DRAFT_416249 [Aulographum hederae CBS 113979]|uniref:glucan endo-1,3-beta-D-glucosidase n=1 Tax=Aulographum hederae CBS 113979 TaxID=1176131 RepID=A0A6G1HHE8_9PEZI|nr:hypothetical protein K402DRAFT_416249 [Aulographum hederae CBS 113979]
MRSFIASLAVVALLGHNAVADNCATGAFNEKGNWYCQAVKKISYSGFEGQGHYNEITGMDKATGTCSSKPRYYSGSLSPLDEEVSVHFRGPLKLKQFAAYSVPATSSKSKRDIHQRRHVHGHQRHHAHKRNEDIEFQERAEAAMRRAEEKRAVGDMVTATINGQVVSWANTYDGHNEGQPAGQPAEQPAAQSTGSHVEAPSSGFIGAKPNSSPAQFAPAPAASGDWSRIGYFNSDSKTAEGVTFLNNKGGQGSGVWDTTFGNSLAYASQDSLSGSANPVTFGGDLNTGLAELVIMTDKKCNNDCGYTREGTVAYHGFDGPSKAFFFEFQMPHEGQTGWNLDMPAMWLLNAQIPRVAQYPPTPGCSCWTSGCGEFDIVEVLDSGNKKCKSTLHSNLKGGDSDYIDRPVDSFMKLAVVMTGAEIHIEVLDSSFDFGKTMSGDAINKILGRNDKLTVSNFKLVAS